MVRQCAVHSLGVNSGIGLRNLVLHLRIPPPPELKLIDIERIHWDQLACVMVSVPELGIPIHGESTQAGQRCSLGP